jgi:thiol:disulfide interchange protein DsbD
MNDVRMGRTSCHRPGLVGIVATAMLAALAALAIPSIAYAGAEPDLFTRTLARGPAYATLAAFLGGLLVCLTPCVYPMIAITVSVFGARQSKSRMDAMLLSTSFVLGIAAMFTPLGLVAGLTGSLFGSALSNPFVVWTIAAIFFALAASMFGAFEFVLPASLTNRLAQVGGIGYGGAFLLGLVSGVIAAPCTGPVLTGILLWIGKSKSAGLGAAVLFAFSIGLGIPFWLVGSFAVHLPKSGRWMVGVKSFFGIVLATAALYFLKNAVRPLGHLVNPATSFAVICAVLIAVGVALGAVHLSFGEGGKWASIRKGVGVVSTVAGLFLLIGWIELPRGHLEWEASEQTARARAAGEARPVLIDFTAEWCGACKELARDTFSDATVMAEASRFVAVKVDATEEDDPNVDQVKNKYHVIGLPTVILLGKNGDERQRFTEFVPPAQFLEALRAVD